MQEHFTPASRDLEVKKLRYHSWHRGCKETDVLLGKFADKYLALFTDEEIVAYKVFLEEDDWDIFNWLTRKAPLPEKHHNSMTDKLLSFTFSD